MKKAVCFFVLGIMLPINSFADSIGVSLGNTIYRYQEGFGDNLFKKNHPTVSAFYQYDFMQNLYAELGLESTFRKTRKEFNPTGSVLSGSLTGADTQNESKSKFNGIYLALMGRHNINDDLALEGGIGIKYVKATLQRTLQDPILGDYLKAKSAKPILKVTTGLKYKINNKFSLRGLISWENSSRLRPGGYTADAGLLWEHKLKNALGYSLGLVYQI